MQLLKEFAQQAQLVHAILDECHHREIPLFCVMGELADELEAQERQVLWSGAPALD